MAKKQSLSLIMRTIEVYELNERGIHGFIVDTPLREDALANRFF